MINESKIFIGLGNPGQEYEFTRHNLGFMVIDRLCNNFKFEKMKEIKDSDGIIFKGRISNKNVFLAKPLTSMNLSGKFVKKILPILHLTFTDLIVIYDDLDIELGTFKLKAKGSCAGHNGIRNIIECLGTENVQRIKVGIRNETYNRNQKIKYVLEKFARFELEQLENVFQRIGRIVEEISKFGFNYSLNCYNNSERVKQ